MNIALVGSAGRCGIYEYSQVLLEGFRALGHQARYIGVQRHDNRDLARCMRQVKDDDQVVILEYEPGIFWLGGLVRAMAWLRFWRRKRIVLSVHEIAPEKYPEFRQVQWHMARPPSQRGLLEVLRIPLCTADVAWRFLTLRVGLLLMGWLPHVVLVHSPQAAQNIRLALATDRKVRYVPLVVKRLEGNRDQLRRGLGLPEDCFAFIIPGFLFRRKQITTVIEQLPSNAELWVVGTESEHDPGYLAEIESYLAQSENREHVRLVHDYDRMEQYLLAADAAVFYYADIYQSASASLAIGAGKPCIFSDLPGFSDLWEAGLIVRTPAELGEAMLRIQEDSTYTRLVQHAQNLRQQLAPAQIAKAYLL